MESEQLNSIELKFQIKGHTRNSCDRGFGIFKQRFVKNEVFTKMKIKEIMDGMGTLSGDVLEMETFLDWGALNDHYKKLDGMSKFQLFSFDSSRKGQSLGSKCLDHSQDISRHFVY